MNKNIYKFVIPTVQESYPSVAPVWFTEMDEQAVVEAVEKVSEMAESQEKILVISTVSKISIFMISIIV